MDIAKRARKAPTCNRGRRRPRQSPEQRPLRAGARWRRRSPARVPSERPKTLSARIYESAQFFEIWRRLKYLTEISTLREKDKIFLAGALGNYSLAGFEMVSYL